MTSKGAAGFKIKKGYGLIVNLNDQTMSYFKNNMPSQNEPWPGTTDNKIRMEVPIRNTEELQRFMLFIALMFSKEHFNIEEIKVMGQRTIVCVYC